MLITRTTGNKFDPEHNSNHKRTGMMRHHHSRPTELFTDLFLPCNLIFGVNFIYVHRKNHFIHSF